MVRNIRKYIKAGAIILGAIITLLLIITLAINFLFREQLIRYVISELNDQVDTRITIGKIDFSIWSTFPNVSVRLDQVFVQSSNTFKAFYSTKEQQDTLLVANEIFLEFNLVKLIGGQYELKRLQVRDGYLKLLSGKDGIENYNILKKTEKPSTKQFNLQLKDLVFDNTMFEYNNIKSSVRIIGLVEKLRLNGNFSSAIDLNISASMYMKSLSLDGKEYMQNKLIRLKSGLAFTDSIFTICHARFSIRKLAFLADGRIIGGKNINLAISGNKLDLSQIMEALPENVKDKLDGFAGKGNANMDIRVTGTVSKEESPDVKVVFTMDNASITQKVTGVKLKEIMMHGTFSNTFNNVRKISILKIDNIKASLGEGYISGEGSIVNFIQPKIKVNISYSIDLNDLKKFINTDTVEICSGNINGNFVSSASLPSFSSVKLSSFSDVKCTGQVNLQDVGIKLRWHDYYFEKINGTILLDSDFLFKQISLKVNDNDFLINGSLTGVLPYLFKQRNDVTLQADVTSEYLDLSKYFVKDENIKVKDEYSRELLFPDNINFDVKVKVKQFKLNKFSAKDISGYVNYKPKIFILKSLSFETLSGKVSGNGLILQDMYKNFVVKVQSDVSKLDIQKMFYTFNNFSQTIIQDRHLRGRVSGQIGFSSEWNNALELNKDKLVVDADFTIMDGQLINFEPMNGLSRFISVDELRNIKFSTLKNHILIKDKQIIIPQMDIASSAFSISASGIHSFDNHYNYKVKVLLSDVLWRKAHKTKQENNEFGEVEDDGLGRTSIPLSIVGYNKDYKIKYDPKLILGDVKESFKEQKTELKTIFKEEFGWYKKDTTLTTTKPAKKGKIRIAWDDADAPTPALEKSGDNETGKNSGEEKPKIEWE
jgi:hypothetical protein